MNNYVTISIVKYCIPYGIPQRQSVLLCYDACTLRNLLLHAQHVSLFHNCISKRLHTSLTIALFLPWSQLAAVEQTTSLTAWFFAVAASQRIRQHLRRRRIFAKSAGVARKSREVTGSHPDLCNTVPGIVLAVVNQ